MSNPKTKQPAPPVPDIIDEIDQLKLEKADAEYKAAQLQLLLAQQNVNAIQQASQKLEADILQGKYKLAPSDKVQKTQDGRLMIVRSPQDSQ